MVIGASMAGLFAAAALAARGWTVHVLERDPLPVDPQHRRGVPQDRQAHILLHRGMVADRVPAARVPGRAAGP